jgi:hypothetical protein
MLDGLKRWLGGHADAAPTKQLEAGAAGLKAWCDSHGYALRGVPDEGFVIEGRHLTTPWRLEWGPSQRPYISGHELRIRAEMGLPADLQVVLMNRALQEEMEKAVFEQYVEGVQTRIDTTTPPEMRWLVMFSRLPGAEMGVLRERYVALSGDREWLTPWLAGPLTETLAGFEVEPTRPLVLMVGRGRLMLRTAMAQADAPTLQPWLRLFETALGEARRVANDSPRTISPSVQPSGWQASRQPGEPAGDK